MQHPTKPIGPFYSRADAEERRRTLGWQIVEDAARGYGEWCLRRSRWRSWSSTLIRGLVDDGVLVVLAAAAAFRSLQEMANSRAWRR